MQPQSSRQPDVNKLFRIVRKFGATDLYLQTGEPPMTRLRGEIRRMEMRALTSPDLEHLLYPIIAEAQREDLDGTGRITFVHVVGTDECRFKCLVVRQDGEFRLSARLIEDRS